MSRGTRREQNQLRFRQANERLHDAVEERVAIDRAVPFLCECADDACLGSVDVPLRTWEDVALRPNHFLMLAGHQRSEGEQVVAHVGEYEVAEKPD